MEWQKALYSCQCIECGYTEESQGHCSALRCPVCGGRMRRVGRPGPGQPFYPDDQSQSGGGLGWVILGLTAFTAIIFGIAYKKAKGIRVQKR